MDTQRYVVLRAVGADTQVLSSGFLSAEALRDVEVEAATIPLTPQELSETNKDPATLRTAPVMPVTLVHPIQAEAGDAHDAAGEAWGLEAVGALRSPFNGKGVRVAVLDTGIDEDHEAFRGKSIVQKDFTGEGDGDRNGHGTHCAGTLFGGEVQGLRIGVAPGVEKAFIGKVLNEKGGGTTEQIVDAIYWAVRAGANVVSMSIEIDFSRMVRDLMAREKLDLEPATSLALTMYRENIRLFDAIAALVNAHYKEFADAVIIAAAGNQSKRPRYEIGTAPPAAADGIISVGALGQQGTGSEAPLEVASFSNARPAVAGPGVGIKSAKRGGGLVVQNGTSMATPHVAGVAALWLQQMRSVNPGADIRQLEGRLIGRASLKRVASVADRVNAGAGLVQAPMEE